MKKHSLISTEGNCEIKKEVHIRKIVIASSNLDDLNNRYSNSKEIIYNCNEFKFEPSDYQDLTNREVCFILNDFVDWDLQVGSERNFQLDYYLKRVKNEYLDLISILTMAQNSGKFNESDKNTVTNFIKHYRDFYPKCFLTNEEESQIQDTFNKYCDDLEDRFLK